MAAENDNKSRDKNNQSEAPPNSELLQIITGYGRYIKTSWTEIGLQRIDIPDLTSQPPPQTLLTRGSGEKWRRRDLPYSWDSALLGDLLEHIGISPQNDVMFRVYTGGRGEELIYYYQGASP